MLLKTGMPLFLSRRFLGPFTCLRTDHFHGWQRHERHFGAGASEPFSRCSVFVPISFLAMVCVFPQFWASPPIDVLGPKLCSYPSFSFTFLPPHRPPLANVLSPKGPNSETPLPSILFGEKTPGFFPCFVKSKHFLFPGPGHSDWSQPFGFLASPPHRSGSSFEPYRRQLISSFFRGITMTTVKPPFPVMPLLSPSPPLFCPLLRKREGVPYFTGKLACPCPFSPSFSVPSPHFCSFFGFCIRGSRDVSWGCSIPIFQIRSYAQILPPIFLPPIPVSRFLRVLARFVRFPARVLFFWLRPPGAFPLPYDSNPHQKGLRTQIAPRFLLIVPREKTPRGQAVVAVFCLGFFCLPNPLLDRIFSVRRINDVL